MIKLMIVGRRRGGMTVAQLHRYMVEDHGAAVVRFIGSHPDETPRRYIQNHVFDASFRVPGAEPDPFSVARDFVTEVWFDSREHAHAAVHAPIYLEHLQPDEDRFVDQASVVRLAVAEQPVFDSPAGAGHRHKLFVFHRRASAVSAADLDTATLALWQPLLADPAAGIGRLVRNRVVGSPDGVQTVDCVDEVWLQDEAAARRLGAHWQTQAEEAPLAPLLVPGAAVVLLARERVMFAGAADPAR